MAQIPKEKKKQIFHGWFIDGDSRDAIAAKLGVGEGSVSNVVKEYEEEIGKPNADLLREQAVARRKAGLKPEDVITDAIFAREVREAGVSNDTATQLFKSLISLVASSSPATMAGTTAEYLVKAAIVVSDMARTKCVGVDKVTTFAEEDLRKHEALKAETAAYVTSRNDAKLQQEKALSENNMTLASLAEWNNDKKVLGIDGIAGAKKASPLLRRMNLEYGWDYSRMVEDFSSNETLREKNKRLLSKIVANQERLKMQAAADAYHKLVEDVPAELKQKIVSRFNRLSVQEGMSPSMVWVKCLWDIDWCYHDLLSLPRLYNQMMTEYNNLYVKVTIKRAQMSFTDAQYDERMRTRDGARPAGRRYS